MLFIGKNVRIAINVSGQISHGMWSPERAESRWSQNLAVCLASIGHTIYSIGPMPSWGIQTPIENITLINQYDLESNTLQLEDIDILIDASWYIGKNQPVKAKKYFHLHWAFEEHLADPNWIKENHFIVYPYIQNKFNFINRDRPPYNPFEDRTLCIAPPCQIDIQSSKWGTGGIVWSGKEAFLNRLIDHDLVQLALQTFDAIEYLSEKYSITFLMSNELNINCSYSKDTLLKYNIPNRIDNIKNKLLINSMPYNELLNILTKNQISIAPAVTLAAQEESIVIGLVPLVRQHLLAEAAKDLNILLPSVSSVDHTQLIINEIERLMNDEQYFNKCLSRYREEIKLHTKQNILNIFSKFEKEYING